MKLSPAAFNRHLNGMGQDFLWRRSYACPCFNVNSGAANQNCKVCTGRGRLWGPEVPAVSGVASQKVQQQWAQFGLWEAGDSVLSIPSDSPMYAMGQFDRLTNLNATQAFSTKFTRGVGEIFIFKDVKVNRVFWLDPTLSFIIEGTAFPTVNADGTLTWPSIGSPPMGQEYSITGTSLSEYFCFMDDPNPRGEHHGRLLPRRVVVRAFDLFGR